MEFYQQAINLIASYKIPVSRKFIGLKMKSHPHYPSLLSLADTLDELGIEYSIILSRKDQLSELYYPLLAHIVENEKQKFVIVKSQKEFIHNTLLKKWDGVVVMKLHGNNHSEIDSLWRKEENSVTLSNYLLFSFIVIGLFSLLYYYNSLLHIALLSLTILGMIICYSIVIYKLKGENSISNLFCGAHRKVNNCDKVLKSKISKWKNIELGDIGFLYFFNLSIFLLLSILTNTQDKINLILALPISLGLIFSCYSIFYQWKIVKAWCKMCLFTMGVIWLQTVVFSISFNQVGWTPVSLLSIIWYTISIGFCIILWIPLKIGIRKIIKSDQLELSLLKWNRNPDAFLSFLSKRTPIESQIWDDDLIIGSPTAPQKLLIACNPYCGPCSQTFKDIFKLIKYANDNVCIIVRFNIRLIKTEEMRITAVNKIINAYKRTFAKSLYPNVQTLFNPIHDWYKDMSIENYTSLYPCLPDEDIYNLDLLKKHERWINDSNIVRTPTFFLNGFEVPSKYSINDIDFILKQM